MSKSRSRLRSAFPLGCLAIVSLLFSFARAQEELAARKSGGDEVQRLEAFEVTGSRIKTFDTESIVPVATINQEDIRNAGYRTLGDYVQSLTFSTGTTNSIVQTSSFTRAASTLNPRGLGANRFLVLVNGRRALTYALTNSNNQSVFDFESLPVAAIASIEYLKDGASAIYGSDAITGVMNIKLKRNYSGVTTSLQVGNTFGHDVLDRSASVVAGAQAGKTDALFSVEYDSTHASFIRDYKRSESTDYTRFGDLVRGTNFNSTLNFPANLNLTAAQAAAAGFTTGSGVYVIGGGQPTANPKATDFVKVATVGNENRYDFADSTQLSPPRDDLKAYAHLRHDVSTNLYVFGDFMLGVNKTYYDYTPVAVQSVQNPGTGPSGLLNVPAANPYNPFHFDLTNFLYRTNFGPPRKFNVKSVLATGLVGAGGTICNDWSWEAAFGMASERVGVDSLNQVRASDLQQALNGTTRDTALNPFGPSDNPAVVNRLFVTSRNSSKVTSQSGDVTVSSPTVFALPAGRVGIALGGEWRHDAIEAKPDTATYVGTGGGTPFRGSRTVQSFYAESTAPLVKDKPLIKNIEVQLAVRHEEYSDFGSATKPKYAAKYQPFDWLTFRGSLSQSFKAPDLGRLYATQTIGFTSAPRTDPKRPQDPATLLRLLTGGNPDLKPENGDVYYAGLVVVVPRIRGLSFSVDYFDERIKNVINTPSDQTILALEDQLPGSVVRDNSQGSPGPIQYLRRIPFNVARQWYRGLDFEVQYGLEKTRLGDFRFRTDWTRIFSLATDNGFGGGKFENVGLYNTPRWRGTATLQWSKGKLSASLRGTFLGRYWNNGYVLPGWQEQAVATASAQVSREFGHGVTLAVGCNNIFDTAPPFNGREANGFDPATYGNLSDGRFTYLRLEKRF